MLWNIQQQVFSGIKRCRDAWRGQNDALNVFDAGAKVAQVPEEPAIMVHDAASVVLFCEEFRKEDHIWELGEGDFGADDGMCEVSSHVLPDADQRVSTQS